MPFSLVRFVLEAGSETWILLLTELGKNLVLEICRRIYTLCYPNLSLLMVADFKPILHRISFKLVSLENHFSWTNVACYRLCFN